MLAGELGLAATLTYTCTCTCPAANTSLDTAADYGDNGGGGGPATYDTAADYGELRPATYDTAADYSGGQTGASMYDTAANNNSLYDTAAQGGTPANGKDYHDAERFEGDYADGGGRVAKKPSDGYLMVGNPEPVASVYDMADNVPPMQQNYDIASGAPQMSNYDMAAQSNPAVYDTAVNGGPPTVGFGRNKKGSLRIHKHDHYDTANC